MQKLLSMLGAVALIGTTSTTVITCDREKPTPTSKIDLNTIITTTNLDKIYVGQLEKPNKKQILEAIKNKNNSGSTLTESDFDFEGTPTSTTATIIGKNNYERKVSLKFTISMFKNINNIGIPQTFTIQNILKINNLIYISTNGGKVYKSNGTDTFTAMSGTSGKMTSLATDKNGNLYAAGRTHEKPSLFISEKLY